MRYFVAVLAVVLFCACSNTWQGAKQDTKNAGKWTKEKVNAGASWVKEKTE